MTYKERLAEAMTYLGQQPDTCVIGYNTTPPGGSGGGSFNGFPLERRHEMPLAEALMTGVAIGMSLDGWVPIVWYERSDFLLHGSDQIVNHMDKMDYLYPGGNGCIVRVCVGNKEQPLFTGPAHTQDLSFAFEKMVKMPVKQLASAAQIMPAYKDALIRARNGQSCMIFELKDLYHTT